jgi:putative phosphoribosyl transferase
VGTNDVSQLDYRPDVIHAVVSRGGRPDLAGDALKRVNAPTLLIVGSNDTVVIELNRKASRSLNAPYHLAIVPGASHIFQEPGTLEKVSRLARDWFQEFFNSDGLNPDK